MVSDGYADKYHINGKEDFTALDLEMKRALPLTTVEVTRDWKPNYQTSFNALRWQRIM
jgi:hypothetical protein